MVNPKYLYNAVVTRVIDGDTIDCTVDLGFHTYIKERFRLYGIDTPEKNSTIQETRDIANKATEFVKTEICGKAVTIESIQKDKYGRWLAKVRIDDTQPTINEQLILLGLAKVYFGDSKINLGW